MSEIAKESNKGCDYSAVTKQSQQLCKLQGFASLSRIHKILEIEVYNLCINFIYGPKPSTGTYKSKQSRRVLRMGNEASFS